MIQTLRNAWKIPELRRKLLFTLFIILLYTVPIALYERFRTDFQTFDIIGHLAQAEVGAVLVSPDGLEHTVSAQGWNPTT